MERIIVSLQNKDRPDLGWVELVLPATEESLNSKLNVISVPYASSECNCIFTKPYKEATPFDFINDELVNVDELNYLAMRLDGFDKYEMAQFQAAAHCENINDVERLINLTFNTRNYTVATNFSDVSSIGKRFYLDEHLSITEGEFEKLNFAEKGYELLKSGNGTVTPFGVVYKHDREFMVPYRGTTFPQYDYNGDTVILIGLISSHDAPDTDNIAWLHLPVPDTSIEKALNRLGIDETDMHMAHIYPDDMPEGIMQRIKIENETIYTINDMCRAIAAVKLDDCPKLDAACEFADVYAACDITAIVKNIALFKIYPGAGNAAEYGYRIAENAGTFQYDQSLSKYFDFKALGEDRMAKEYGRFTGSGYTVFSKTPEVLDGLLTQEQSGTMAMG